MAQKVGSWPLNIGGPGQGVVVVGWKMECWGGSRVAWEETPRLGDSVSRLELRKEGEKAVERDLHQPSVSSRRHPV